MFRKKVVSIVAMTGLVAGILSSASAPAHAVASGAGTFNCRARLSVFPGFHATGRCNGTTLASVHVYRLGVTVFPTPKVEKLIVIDPGNFDAEFTYSEPCLAGEPPLTGTAEGTATITNAIAIEDDLTMSTATETADFQWTRVGAVAVIVTSPFSVETSRGTTATGDFGGAAVAAFAPLPPIPTCDNPGPLEAEVLGAWAEAI